MLMLAGCAEPLPHQQPPPPPARPSIEGSVKSVSSADIRLVLELKGREMIQSDRRMWPIYSVRVVDHNHIQIHYWSSSVECWAYAERIKGKWALSNTERVIVRGSNIPTP
jgi:hypothetical protein